MALEEAPHRLAIGSAVHRPHEILPLVSNVADVDILVVVVERRRYVADQKGRNLRCWRPGALANAGEGKGYRLLSIILS